MCVCDEIQKAAHGHVQRLASMLTDSHISLFILFTFPVYVIKHHSFFKPSVGFSGVMSAARPF